VLLDDKVLYAAMSRPNLPFGDGGASARIVEICRLHLAREAGAGLMD
jgi:UDP-N-acetylglucosamine 2-epimerase